MRIHRFPQPAKRRSSRYLWILFIGGIAAGAIWFFAGKNGNLINEPVASAAPQTSAAASELSVDAYLSRALPLPFKEEYPQGNLSGDIRFDKIVVQKNKRRMLAYSKGKIVRVYGIALGLNPIGHKEVEGDMRTPEGTYLLDAKSDKSAFYKNINVSYPNDADRAHAKLLGKSPGGDIKIHGLAPSFAFVGSAHKVSDWTHGCIAVTNEEIDELFERIVLGSPIIINP